MPSKASNSAGPGALREGAAGGSQSLAPPTKQPRPMGLREEEIRLSAPLGANPRQAGPLWVLRTGPMPQHAPASANVVRVAGMMSVTKVLFPWCRRP